MTILTSTVCLYYRIHIESPFWFFDRFFNEYRKLNLFILYKNIMISFSLQRQFVMHFQCICYETGILLSLIYLIKKENSRFLGVTVKKIVAKNRCIKYSNESAHPTFFTKFNLSKWNKFWELDNVHFVLFLWSPIILLENNDFFFSFTARIDCSILLNQLKIAE